MRSRERLQLIDDLRMDYLLYLAAERCDKNVEEHRDRYNKTLNKLVSERL